MLCYDDVVRIPEHVHDQAIAWVRVDPTLNVGLGGGWQAAASLPYDVRTISVRYMLPDGTPYAPPYDDIHHRDETLDGLVDGTLSLRRFVAVKGWIVGGGFGSTVPLGATEANPWRLTAQGLRHQHQQLGAGVPSPIVMADTVQARGRLGLAASAQARAGVLENDEGFRPAHMASVSAAPSWRLTPTAQVLAGLEGAWNGPDRWDGVAYGGRTMVAANAGVVVGLDAGVVLQAQGRVPVWQALLDHDHGDDEEGTYAEGPLITVGLSWTRRPTEP